MGVSISTTGTISIHAPRGGSDLMGIHRTTLRTISIHAPRGGSDVLRGTSTATLGISIHAPRGGSDSDKVCEYGHQKKFQSTLPVGGATRF